VAIRDLNHAERGETVRIPFLTLLAGVLTAPISAFSVTIHLGQDESAGATATLTPVADDVGKLHVDWAVPLTQAIGIYTAFISAEVAPATFFVDRIRFEVFEVGTFAAQTQTTAAGSTFRDRISNARNEVVMIQLIRVILRDHPELNRLTENLEHSDGDIRIAIARAVSAYNSVPPLLQSVSVQSFPSPEMLVVGALAYVIESTLFLRVRNHLPYTDGSISLDTENVPIYSALRDSMMRDYREWIPGFKISLNLSNGLGLDPSGLHSEYFFLSGYLGDAFLSTPVLA